VIKASKMSFFAITSTNYVGEIALELSHFSVKIAKLDGLQERAWRRFLRKECPHEENPSNMQSTPFWKAKGLKPLLDKGLTGRKLGLWRQGLRM
jgi:hypothetical protein